MIRLRHFLPVLALLAVGVGQRAARAQELEAQATPFSVWLDFEAMSKLNAPKGALPIWMESISFFDELGATPVVSGWTETGAQPYMSPMLGTGLNLPSSETLVVPAGQLDYIDITVPGNGVNLRGATIGLRDSTDAAASTTLLPASKLLEGSFPAERDHVSALTGKPIFVLQNVPEPSSVTLLALGSLGLLARRRRNS